jgi:hypothetical protein
VGHVLLKRRPYRLVRAIVTLETTAGSRLVWLMLAWTPSSGSG